VGSFPKVRASTGSRAQQKFDSSAYSYVRAAFLYQFRDWTSDGSVAAGDWEENLGVLRRDFTPKPSLASFKAYNTTGAVPPNQAPQVKLTSPAEGATFSSSLTVSAEASDDAKVSKVVFLIDGRAIGTDYSAPYGMTWTASKKTSYGSHTVTAKAYDDGGLSESSSVTVTRARTTTTLSISSTAMRAGKRSSGGRRAVVTAGRVKLARGGRLRIVVRRYDAGSGRWVKGSTVSARVDRTGKYRAMLSLPAGRWRAQALYAGKPRSQSKVVTFSS